MPVAPREDELLQRLRLQAVAQVRLDEARPREEPLHRHRRSRDAQVVHGHDGEGGALLADGRPQLQRVGLVGVEVIHRPPQVLGELARHLHPVGQVRPIEVQRRPQAGPHRRRERPCRQISGLLGLDVERGEEAAAARLGLPVDVALLPTCPVAVPARVLQRRDRLVRLQLDHPPGLLAHVVGHAKGLEQLLCVCVCFGRGCDSSTFTMSPYLLKHVT